MMLTTILSKLKVLLPVFVLAVTVLICAGAAAGAGAILGLDANGKNSVFALTTGAVLCMMCARWMAGEYDRE